MQHLSPFPLEWNVAVCEADQKHLCFLLLQVQSSCDQTVSRISYFATWSLTLESQAFIFSENNDNIKSEHSVLSESFCCNLPGKRHMVLVRISIKTSRQNQTSIMRLKLISVSLNTLIHQYRHLWLQNTMTCQNVWLFPSQLPFAPRSFELEKRKHKLV